jgi:Ribosomal protein S7p/S5e
MMHGRNNGKKIKAVEIVRNACEIIHLLTDSNPIQVIVDAVINRWATHRCPLCGLVQWRSLRCLPPEAAHCTLTCHSIVRLRAHV